MNVSGLSVENRSPALNDDSPVPVLISRTVTVDLSRRRILRHAVGLFSHLFVSSADPVVELSLTVFAVVAAVEKSYRSRAGGG